MYIQRGRLSAADPRLYLEELSQGASIIVQEYLRNHAALLRMPARAESPVDDFHAGGIAAGIDLQTGVLGPASNLGLSGSPGWLDHHPRSGARELFVGPADP